MAPSSAHVSAHVALALARHVDAVFGLMGNGNAYFLDALLRRTDATFTAVRHEQGAVVAADAHFRASGRIAAATATYGAGFTNTLTALAEAVQARIPLVLVVGDEPTSGPRAWDVDQIALAAAVGARTYTVGRTDAAATTIIALEHALTYRVPVVLALPYDVAAQGAGPVTDPAPLRRPAPAPPQGAFAEGMISEIADALRTAARPHLLAGRGAWLADAGPALGRLADLTGALTSTTALGRGIFPASDFDLGVTGGFGADGAMALIGRADVVVVFGAGLNPFTMRFGALFSPGTRVYQVDIAPAATHAHVSGFVRGDARLVAEELVRLLSDPVHNFGADARRAGPVNVEPGVSDAASEAVPARLAVRWRESVDVAAARAYDTGDEVAPDGRLDPRSAARRLAEVLPEDRVVVTDGGHFLGWSNMYWPVASPDRMMMVGTAFQAIGLGWPSLVGAAVARPGTTVVLNTGDGGGLMALADLESAVRVARGHGCAIVWNDAAYGAEINLYGLKGLAEEPMRIPEVDFAALGTALGARGLVVRRLADLDHVRDWAADDPTGRPFLLVDLRICGSIIAPYQEEIIRVNS